MVEPAFTGWIVSQDRGLIRDIVQSAQRAHAHGFVTEHCLDLAQKLTKQRKPDFIIIDSRHSSPGEEDLAGKLTTLGWKPRIVLIGTGREKFTTLAIDEVVGYPVQDEALISAMLPK